jgi:ubiquinone/menaquinone biosynthesis C-methylase UbiE
MKLPWAIFAVEQEPIPKNLQKDLGKIKKATLIDINSKFLELAKLSPSPIQELEIINGDMSSKPKYPTNQILSSLYLLIITSPTKKKEYYIKKIKEALKKNGILILTEIYVPNHEIAKRILSQTYKRNSRNRSYSWIRRIFERTSENTDFEFKVPKKLADKQFEEEGFRKVEEVKVRPLDDSFEENIGTFVQVYTH